MKRSLSTVLLLSHVAVAVVSGVVTFVVIRLLVPYLYDNAEARVRGRRRDPLGGAGPRQFLATAVDQSLLIGALLGISLAAIVALLLSNRIVAPLKAMAGSTRKLARGDYAVAMPEPGTQELTTLAGDISYLAQSLESTEARRVRLLGEVAHEMRTPLTVIDGYVEAFQDGVMAADPDKLSLISVELRRLGRLCDDLSMLSRAQEGRLDVVLTPIDITATARAVCDRLRPQALERGLTLDFCDAPALIVDGDADRLTQIFTNLVGNALKATTHGGITVGVRQVGERVGVDVVDTGEGIAPGDLERIFERFYRVRPEGMPAPTSGSGIGLTIARQIARAHGGDVVAHSAGPGHGATMTVWLPLSHPNLPQHSGA